VLAAQLARPKDVGDQADICERLNRELANAKAILTIYATDKPI
jgi:hypothetical protein